MVSHVYSFTRSDLELPLKGKIKDFETDGLNHLTLFSNTLSIIFKLLLFSFSLFDKKIGKILTQAPPHYLSPFCFLTYIIICFLNYKSNCYFNPIKYCKLFMKYQFTWAGMTSALQPAILTPAYKHAL